MEEKSKYIEVTILENVFTESGKKKNESINDFVSKNEQMSDKDRKLKEILGEYDEDEDVVHQIVFLPSDFKEEERKAFIEKDIVDYFYEDSSGEHSYVVMNGYEPIKIKETVIELNKKLK